MSQILEIKGKVHFKITLDPTVWIFDDRRIDLDNFFTGKTETEEPEISYEEKMSNYWHREIREGSVAPPTLKTERKLERMKMLTGTFGISLEPFLKNAEPLSEASDIIFESKKENVTIPIEKANEIILKFSENGKPLRESGPLHVLFKDGSNVNNPITDVTAIIIN